MANSIEEIKAGASFIDASLLGMGKGAGNLALESWLALLNFYEKKERDNIELMLNQINILREFWCIFQRLFIRITRAGLKEPSPVSMQGNFRSKSCLYH